MAISDSSNSPVVRSLQLLTTGWGYNYYDDANKARADDQLVRQKAAYRLGEAASALTDLEAAYRAALVPASTRENPFPAPEIMERLRAIGRLKSRIDERAVRIRGVSAPTQDKIWFRLRQERTLLVQLLTYDESLIAATATVAELARALTVSGWNADPAAAAAPIDAVLFDIDDSLRSRHDLLLMPTL